MQVSIHHMVLTLSRAVDLVGVTDVYHGRRVGIIAVEIGRRLGLDREAQRQVFDAALLHDCGVSSTQEHSRITSEFESDVFDRHCQRGCAALAAFEPLAHLAPIVLHHHTGWKVLPRDEMNPTQLRTAALIHLADRIDSLAGPHYRDQSLLLHVEAIRDRIHGGRGRMFAPEMVDAFMAASIPEAFWLQLDVAYIPQYVEEMASAAPPVVVTLDELKSFSGLIAKIVDAKSHFTAEHSIGVARLTRLLGGLHGYAGDHLTRMEIAALLHDIGKLQVPDAVLESPHPLTPAERAIIKKHSFATWQILRQVGGFEELSLWAAEHHECPAGNGYPFRLSAREIPPEARIIKVADVYQALAQRRPYREPMAPRDIVNELHRMAERSEVDADAVALVARNVDECQRAAVGA